MHETRSYWFSSFRRAAVFRAALAAAVAIPAAVAAAEVQSTAAERESLALTVYNHDLALVKETRRAGLPGGEVRLAWREVAALLRPETALLRASDAAKLTLIEQSFDFDLLTPAKLLEKYVGREVGVVRTNPATGEEKRERALLLSATAGPVLRFADRIETGVPGRLVFTDLPADLRERPTLSMLLEAPRGNSLLELSYLTGGLSWQADYVANLAPDGKTLDLDAWVTLSNKSGADFRQATLQLVAGSVNRAARPAPEMMADMALMARAKVAMPQEEALLDYHLYRFERPTTVLDNQTKQLALLSATRIPVQREYRLRGAERYPHQPYREREARLKPALFLEFANKNGQLGKPLPAGIIRVYARDSQGAAQFVGEDRIEHTAKNETLRLRLGEVFDITGERRQTGFRRIADNVSEFSWHIGLRNAKTEAVTVIVEEPLAGDWEILHENLPHDKTSATTATWKLVIPAGETGSLDYTVRVKG
ncbi:MAG: DUF4139 domain-containing protein [Betaproteobacteria bacterium HGW-Betaproteobacteria-11]|nr:MAG: DUF4139 domain-containing protein [Betaproteobacteria bacterium HGW-Betaproteobacteria-11]